MKLGKKKETVAMLLAGGQGSRLYVLTEDQAKPAVPFGGKFRIIDFPLSNCANSGIDTVGVLTQYKPLQLNAYIGTGQPWDLDRLNGGVYILPPYMTGKAGQWYKGTANAIYQNIAFIDQYDPEYVLVLSADHIYKMDYQKMITYHKEKGGAATIAVLDVPESEAGRFGILNTYPDGRVYEFEEKPVKPKSTLASMGIYVFSWQTVRQYLIADEADTASKNDFGHDILPKMLAAEEKMFAYTFTSYWKDVGTIESLWDANMDILSSNSGLDLQESRFKIFTRNTHQKPQYIAPSATLAHSVVSEGCEIYGTVENSVVYTGVTVAEDATVRYSILMPGVVVEPGAVIEYAIIGEDAVIGTNAQIGMDPKNVSFDQWGVAVVGPRLSVCSDAVVAAREIVSENITKEGGDV